MTLSATTTASFTIATPLLEKKLFCVKKRSCSKSCTQIMTPSTASRLRDTWSKMMLHGAPRLLAPLTTSAVNWKTWTKHGNYGKELRTRKSTWDITYRVKMKASRKSRLWGPERQDFPYIKAIPRGDALQLSLITHEKLIISLSGFHSWAANPTQLHQAIQKLAKQMIRGMVIHQSRFPDKSSSALAQHLAGLQLLTGQCSWVPLKTSGHPSGTHSADKNCPQSPVPQHIGSQQGNFSP